MVKQPISAIWSHVSAGRITLISLDTGGIFGCSARLVCSDISACYCKYGTEHGFIWSLHQWEIQREMEKGKKEDWAAQGSNLDELIVSLAYYLTYCHLCHLYPFLSIHPTLYPSKELVRFNIMFSIHFIIQLSIKPSLHSSSSCIYWFVHSLFIYLSILHPMSWWDET